MDRALRANIIAKSGKAVETAGDVDTLLLDKTGTITIGNRKATNFYLAEGTSETEFIELAALSSLADDTPEGKSIVELAQEKGISISEGGTNMEFIDFTAETRSSGVNLSRWKKIRKGAQDTITQFCYKKQAIIPRSHDAKDKIDCGKWRHPIGCFCK